MKKTDLAALIFIASVSVILAYFVASALIGKPSGDPQKVSTITPITAVVDDPDPTIFNKDAINPTIEVTIGGSRTP